MNSKRSNFCFYFVLYFHAFEPSIIGSRDKLSTTTPPSPPPTVARNILSKLNIFELISSQFGASINICEVFYRQWPATQKEYEQHQKLFCKHLRNFVPRLRKFMSVGISIVPRLGNIQASVGFSFRFIFFWKKPKNTKKVRKHGKSRKKWTKKFSEARKKIEPR